MNNSKRHGTVRAFVLAVTLATAAAASGDWVIFKGQVNGPVAKPAGIDLDSFRLKNFPGMFWDETYYHHLNFPDGSMITVSIGFNHREINYAFVYGKPGMEPFKDYIIPEFEEAKFDGPGFGFTIGKNRVRLEGNKYTMEIDLPKTKGTIAFDILAPSYTYGDGYIRYPDGDTYGYYTMPISWAKVTTDLTLDGKPCQLTGSASMNHDATVMFPTDAPTKWQTSWFFGPDHALIITNHFTHQKYGGKLTQRLVFIAKDGRMFTSTEYPMKWDDWTDAAGAPFRYPRHYTLTAEGGGEKIEADIKFAEVLLIADLYSNLPAVMRIVAEQLTANCWTVDAWCDYSITYHRAGAAETYQGRGVFRWTDLEKEKP